MLGAKFSRNELPLLTGMSALLIDEYLKLIGEHDALPKEGVACRSGAQAIHGSKRKGPPEGGS